MARDDAPGALTGVTGARGGVGAARIAPDFLTLGDVPETRITSVGVLRTMVREG